MNMTRHIPSSKEHASQANEVNPGFRTKTVATRLTLEELAAIEAAAESAGQVLSEWLRETALHAARQQPPDPSELLLAEVWALRYTLLNFFYAGAQATLDNRQLLPDSILKIREEADVQKFQKAHKLLDDFLGQGNKKGSRKP